MANTYRLIGSKSIPTDGTTSVTFTSIPQNFTDLVLKLSARDDGGNQAYIVLNSSTDVFYTVELTGDGTNASFTSSNGGIPKGTLGYSVNQNTSRTADTFGNAEIYISNYSNSTYNKFFTSDGVEENDATTAFSRLFSSVLEVTTAVSSIKLSSAGTFQTYSTFYLYGVSNA